MSMRSIAVLTKHPALQKKAQKIAADLHLPFITTPSTEWDYYLLLTPDYLGLQQTGTKTLPLVIDFLSPKIQYRCKKATVKREILARALGLKNKSHPTMIDATGGLARDSFILACLGFEVKVLERSPIIFALLKEGIRRGQQDPATKKILSRLHLIQTNAIDWLPQLKKTERPELIYLDPMFPERQKSAAVKKEMKIFHDIIGEDDDAEALLRIALACATERVVVKRPRNANVLAGIAPHFTLTGSSSRFDIYLTRVSDGNSTIST